MHTSVLVFMECFGVQPFDVPKGSKRVHKCRVHTCVFTCARACTCMQACARTCMPVYAFVHTCMPCMECVCAHMYSQHTRVYRCAQHHRDSSSMVRGEGPRRCRLPACAPCGAAGSGGEWPAGPTAWLELPSASRHRGQERRGPARPVQGPGTPGLPEHRVGPLDSLSMRPAPSPIPQSPQPPTPIPQSLRPPPSRRARGPCTHLFHQLLVSPVQRLLLLDPLHVLEHGEGRALSARGKSREANA